jgi:hypothetical protein
VLRRDVRDGTPRIALSSRHARRVVRGDARLRQRVVVNGDLVGASQVRATSSPWLPS